VENDGDDLRILTLRDEMFFELISRNFIKSEINARQSTKRLNCEYRQKPAAQ
jgi:hypothetical protein